MRSSTGRSQVCASHREKWQVGEREDWRYADMRTRHLHHWWWLSFFAVYLIQARRLLVVSLGGLPS